MTSLTFYGGVKEIGGNKILLHDGDTKIFLDFGMSFGKRGKFFEEFLTPRSAAGIKDFLATGLIPDIKGVYRDDLLKHIGRPAETPEVQGVILSHAHADHANYITFLHKDIPIHCGETAKRILDAIQESSSRDIENEVIDFKKRPLFREDYRKPATPRTFNLFRTGQKFKIDSLEIEPIHVDHCLTEDTMIQLSNGELTKVKDIEKSNFINVMDFKTGNVVHALASKNEYDASQLFKIKTRFNEVNSTGEHKFFCLNDLDVIEKKAKDLKRGDFLLYVKEIPFEGKEQNLPKIKIRKVVGISEDGLRLIKGKRKEMKLFQRELAKGIGMSKFYQEFESGIFNIEIENLKRILTFLKINENVFMKKYASDNNSLVVPEKTSPELLQLMGYALGDGSWSVKSKKCPYLDIADKDIKNLELYQNIASSVFGVKGKIVKKHVNILRLSTYVGRLFHEISPNIFSRSWTRSIPKLVHKSTKNEIAAFLRGLYDAEGSVGHHSIILTSTSKDIIDMTKLLLLRFGILSWTYDFIEPLSKRKAYQLSISHRYSMLKFEKNIRFGSEAKLRKLNNFLSISKKSKIERIDLIPFNGASLKAALKEMEISSLMFQKAKINIGHYTSGKHYVSRDMLKRIYDFIKTSKKGNKDAIKKYVGKIEKILLLKAIFDPVKSIGILNDDPVVYDFEVPGYSNFIANGYLVHNSVPGAYGFIIHTSSGPIVYTGDLRLHGLHSQDTMDFVKRAKEVKPIALITEGTRINVPKTDESEPKVFAESKKQILMNDKLAIVDFNFKDVDRFKTFYQIALETNKKLVINFKHACYLDRYCTDKKLDVPNCSGKNIYILKPKRMTGTYDDSDYTESFVKERLNLPNIVTAEDIVKKPNDFILVLNFWYFNTLIDLKPENGLYIHSLSEPFNEEMEMSHDRMSNWLNHFKMRYVQSHCSGHINGPDMKELLNMINAKIVYPIHTEYPGKFRDISAKVKMIKEGQVYKI